MFLGDKIILNCGPGERTFVTAINAANGKTVWQQDETGGVSGLNKGDAWLGSWSTPVVATLDGRKQILVSFPHHVNAYNPSDGKIIWTCDGLDKLAYTSPVIGDGIVVAMGGYHGPALGVKVQGTGDITESNRLWLTKTPNPQRIGTGVVVGKHLYMANENSTAQCFEIETGKRFGGSACPRA